MLPILPFKDCQFLTVILQSSAMYPPSGSYISTETVVLCPPWNFSSWSLSIQEIDLLSFCLAWHGQGHWPLVFRLHSLSTKQDPTPCQDLSSKYSGSWKTFAHVHIDLVGSLPSASSQAYILTMIDRTTCWPVATPLTSISAESCALAFISCFAGGHELSSTVWARVCKSVNHGRFLILPPPASTHSLTG